MFARSPFREASAQSTSRCSDKRLRRRRDGENYALAASRPASDVDPARCCWLAMTSCRLYLRPARPQIGAGTAASHRAWEGRATPVGGGCVARVERFCVVLARRSARDTRASLSRDRRCDARGRLEPIGLPYCSTSASTKVRFPGTACGSKPRIRAYANAPHLADRFCHRERAASRAGRCNVGWSDAGRGRWGSRQVHDVQSRSPEYIYQSVGLWPWARRRGSGRGAPRTWKTDTGTTGRDSSQRGTGH